MTKTTTIKMTMRKLNISPVDDMLALLPDTKLREMARAAGVPIGKYKRVTVQRLAGAALDADAEIELRIKPFQNPNL